MERHIIQTCKEMIERNALESLKEYYTMIQQEQGDQIDWQHIFLKVYLHACLKKRKEIVSWLEEVYDTFDPISKIALRQTFPYARYLLYGRQQKTQG
jgi:hypothetical protein